MIKILLYISIFLFIYNFIKLIYFLKIKKKFKSNSSINKYTNSRLFFILRKIPMLEKINKDLNMLNNPFNFNIKNFCLFKVILFITFFILTFQNYNSIFFACIISIIASMLPDLLIILNKKKQREEIESDLLQIVDSIYLQVYSNITLDKIFKTISKDCKNKSLKTTLVSVSNVYEYSGFNIQSAIQELKDKFDIMEVEMLCNVLVEQVMLGENLSVIENLSNLLRQNYSQKLKKSTNKKVVLITIGIVITLINITLIVFYPILNIFNSSFNNIFG